jgi:hypothetical protein
VQKEVVNYQRSDKVYLALKQTVINKLADATTFDRLLQTYSLTSFYKPQSDAQSATKLLTENYIALRNYPACLQAANGLLINNYVSLIGHYAASECAKLAGDQSTADYHAWVLNSLFEAIWRTGDGQSPESAFMINSSSDLNAFVQLHQRVAVAQELMYLRQVPIQKISMRSPESNRLLTWYFNLTPQFRRGVIDEIEARAIQ